MQNQSLFDRLNSRAQELIANRASTDGTWQEIADNLLGRRDFQVKATEPGRQRQMLIYDDTSKVSASLLAGAMHSLLTSPSARWFALRFEDPEMADDDEAMKWLALVEKRIYAALSAPAANFHAQLAECYTDLIGFGTGGLFVDDVEGVGVQFSARPLQELFIAEDPSGRIDTIVRKFDLTARQAVKLWGDDAKLATKQMESGSGESKSEYLHIIVPSDEYSERNIDESGMPWSSYHLSSHDKSILSTGGFHELPLATPRWEKEPGEVYGRGPGWNALSNQKMLNKMKKVTLTAGQKAVDPPLLVDSESVLGSDFRTSPGALIPIDGTMSMMSPPVQALQFGGDFRIGETLISDTRKAVQDSFLHQLIETIRDPRMTATQVLELAAQMQRHLAPILGRMTTELLEPVLERVYAIELRAGRLPEAPPHISDRPLKIDYVSPVARAQQTSDARAIIDFSGIVANLAQASPEVLDIVDFDQGTRELADALGVPATMIRDTKSVAKRREAAAIVAEEQAAEAEQAAMVDQATKVMGALPQGAAA